MGRAFIDRYDNTTSGVDAIRQAMVYPLSEAQNPPQQKFVDALGQQAKLQYPTTEGSGNFCIKPILRNNMSELRTKTLLE